MYIYVYIYVYMYIHIYICICIYIYVYIQGPAKSLQPVGLHVGPTVLSVCQRPVLSKSCDTTCENRAPPPLGCSVARY